MFVTFIMSSGGTGGVKEGHVARICFVFFSSAMTHGSPVDTYLSSVEKVRLVGFHSNEVSKKQPLAISSLSL